MLGDDVAIALVVVSHGDVAGTGPRVFGRKSRNKGRRVVLWIGSCPSFCTMQEQTRNNTERRLLDGFDSKAQQGQRFDDKTIETTIPATT